MVEYCEFWHCCTLSQLNDLLQLDFLVSLLNFSDIDFIAHNLAHSSVNSSHSTVNSSSSSSCSFSHSCALVVKCSNSSSGLVFGTDACAPATVLNIGPSMSVLSMIRYYVCPFDKRQERYCPYQLSQSRTSSSGVLNEPVWYRRHLSAQYYSP